MATMTEAEGCALLKLHFEQAGFSITEHYRFTEGGLDVALDGFDSARRVGYEYITTAAGDRAEITPAVLDHLERRMERQELYVLLLDEHQAPSAVTLLWAVDRFFSLLPSRFAPPGGAKE